MNAVTRSGPGKYAWLVCAAGALAACPTTPDPAVVTASDADVIPAPLDASVQTESPAPIARCGDIVLTLADYESALDHMRVYRPIEGDVLGSPRFQQGTVINLVDIRLLRAAALEHGVFVVPGEVAEAIGADPRLAAAPIEMARVVAADAVLNRKLTDALSAVPGDEVLWEAWKARTERVEIEFVAVPNTPTSAALTAFVRDHAAEIDRYFRDNPGKFQLPPTRRVQILELSGPDAREKLAVHRVDLADGADFASLARKLSVHATRSQGGELGWVVKRQRPEAFAVEVGQITEPFRTRSGFALVRVAEALPARPVELTGAVRREIAADLLRNRGPDPAATQTATLLRQQWAADALDPELARLGLRKQASLPFSDVGDEDAIFLPGIGRAPGVVRAVRGLEKPGDVAGPVFSAGRHYVVRLLSRGKATRTAFAAEKAEFSSDFVARRRRTAVPELLERRRSACGLKLDLSAVTARYGRTEKPGR